MPCRPFQTSENFNLQCFQTFLQRALFYFITTAFVGSNIGLTMAIGHSVAQWLTIWLIILRLKVQISLSKICLFSRTSSSMCVPQSISSNHIHNQAKQSPLFCQETATNYLFSWLKAYFHLSTILHWACRLANQTINLYSLKCASLMQNHALNQTCK